ncbi:hypothetical protein BGZ97_010774, partial [Linnemannia gamsii]
FLGSHCTDLWQHIQKNLGNPEGYKIGRTMGFQLADIYSTRRSSLFLDGGLVVQKDLARRSRNKDKGKSVATIRKTVAQIKATSEKGRWSSGSKITTVKKKLPSVFVMTAQFKQDFIRGLREVFETVIECKGEADTAIGQLHAISTSITVDGEELQRIAVSGDSDLHGYTHVKYVLRVLPGHAGYRYLTKDIIRSALDVPSDEH